MYKGIDVSYWNESIDFKKVKNDGIDFVIVRAGYSEVDEDIKWKQNVYNAKLNNLHIGAYWFMYFINETQAKNCADKFVRLLRQFDGAIDFPVALDVEEDTYRWLKECGVSPTKETITRLANIFCERVEKAGYYVMIYSNHNGFNNYLGDVSRYDKWIADLSGNQPNTDMFGIWQHSFKGVVNGIRGSVDLDIAFRDYPTIIRNAKLNHLEPKQNTSVEKPKENVKENVKLKVGDIVKVTNPIIYGTNDTFTLWYEHYNIIELIGNRAVIGKGKVITAPIDIKYLRKV